eukprot:TRINITY_DN62734_c0_g1_i1.p1 TRINITY_DN62734_c0_g1~~TRINITY_DN62734_c0_g1_i1.p1  ORF type:complete len:311 (+),score=55.53 TRINITY_DN62734_c0_g1_i1:67-999(+)
MVVKLEIPDSVKIGSCLHSYTEYSISVAHGRRQWTVARRYRDFLALHEKMMAIPGCSRPLLPPKGLVGLRHALDLGAFNEKRREGLEQYLVSLLGQVSSPDDVTCLAEFLEVETRTETCANICNQIDPFEKFGLPKPIFMVPKKDMDEAGDNGIIEVAFGEAKDVDGVEVTVIFKDEDRPNATEDGIYDAIRKPLFGRQEDVETFTFVRGKGGRFDSVLFKGTYSGDQNWSCATPAHLTETVSLSSFTKEGRWLSRSRRTVIWVNVWNHLFGPKNNNLDLAYVRVDDYPCTCATRAEVDARYHGLITTVA